VFVTVAVTALAVALTLEYENVVYDRPCPNANSGSSLFASYQRYPTSSISL
jgi:hypothetical protein